MRSSTRISIASVLLVAVSGAAMAQAKGPDPLVEQSLKAHFRSDNPAAVAQAVREGGDRIRMAAAKAPQQRIVATVFFREGVSPDRLAQIATANGLDITNTDAKVSMSDSGDTFTLLTRESPVSAEQLAGKLRDSERSAMQAIISKAAAPATTGRATMMGRTQPASDAPAPAMRFYSAKVIGSQASLASVASLGEVLTITIDVDAPGAVEKLQTERRALFDAGRSSRMRQYLKAKQAAVATPPRTGPATKAAISPSPGTAASTNAGGGYATPPPDWFGHFDQDVNSDGDVNENKMDVFPIEYYYQCLGHACPNDWTWIPRSNRKWQLGILRHPAGCYLVPTFYYNWDDDDDTVDSGSWSYIEICDPAWTEGSVYSQFKFTNRQKDTPWTQMSTLQLAAYHDSLAPRCNVGPTEVMGVGFVEWPCAETDVNAVYVKDSTIEDESHIPNPHCTIQGTRNPTNAHNQGCFFIYRILTNLPAPYDDDDTFDPGQEFQATVGSANASAFNSTTTYVSVIWFAAMGLEYLAGQTAVHELEIGTAFPGQWCAPYCVFKTKESTLETAMFYPVKPAGLSVSNITGVSAKANWTNASEVSGLTGYEWRVNGGSWNAAAASPATMNGLSPNTAYTLEVRAVDTAGTRGPAESTSFTTPTAITISNRNVSSSNTSTTFSQTWYRLSNTGDIITTAANDANQVDVGDWLVPKTGMANYQVRKSAGTCNGPGLGVWISLSTSPSWLAVAGGYPHASASCWVTLEIGAVANPAEILGSATITLSSSH